MTIEKIKTIIWRILYAPYYHTKYRNTKSDRDKIQILDSTQSIERIITNKLSVARFGDGELQMIEHFLNGGTKENFNVDSFQDYDRNLGEKLYNILLNRRSDLLCCLPYPFKDSKVYYGYDRIFFEREWLGKKRIILDTIKDGAVLGDTDFTRFYLHRRDIKDYSTYIKSMQAIWDNRDIVFIEGKFSRLGVGNDLFDNAKSRRRIVCPAVNAFAAYDTILEEAKKLEKDCLILLALGHTATVLADELSREGFQAIDIGHVDIEYEWYLMGATEKIPIPNKYVNETKAGRIINSHSDRLYESEIICTII